MYSSHTTNHASIQVFKYYVTMFLSEKKNSIYFDLVILIIYKTNLVYLNDVIMIH
jgi:hypothetical protein